MRFATSVVLAIVAYACGGSGDTPQQPAAQSESSTAAKPASATGGLTINLRTNPNPPKSGDNALEVAVTDATGAPVTDATVQVEFMMPAMPSMNMPAMRSNAALTHQGGGRYTGTGQLSMAGTWTTTVTVTRPGQEAVTRRQSINAN